MSAVGDRPCSRFDEMTDEIRDKHQNSHKNALIRDIKAHTVGENARLGITRLAAHDVRFRLFHAQPKRRETVGYEVYPEQVNGFKHGEAHQRCGKNAKHLTHI